MLRGLALGFACSLAAAGPAEAQQSLQEALATRVDPAAQMMLEADSLNYDFDRDVVSASGTVQIYYDGYTLEARQVSYDRRNGRLTARGAVRMTEPDGNVLSGEEMELSDDFADGFARSLQLDTPERTRFVAETATRSGGNVTTFENGVYTVYTRPTTPPGKPPLWRLRAARIIHNQQERVIYYEDAALEFFGQPVAYLPYLSMPDPTVKRKSGFLMPSGVYSDRLGVGVTVPYYWALDPHFDLTVAATPMSKQGALGEVSWRHRLMSGSYTVAAAGLFQARPNEFAGSSGDRRWRGAIHTDGEFRISRNWKWGWDLTYKTDRAFLEDYSAVSFSGKDEISQIYLSGETRRNALSVRAYAFSITQEDYNSAAAGHDPVGPFSPVGSDLQDKQPFVLPVVDYDYVFDDPVAGGELSLTSNFTSLTRAKTDAFAVGGVNRYRGVDGTFSRWSVMSEWRRTLIDPLGQVFTPFAYVRGDLFFLASADKNVTTLTDDAFVGRAVPAAGLEYRYPFVATFDGGNQIIEPIAQVIVRPDEQRIGQLPNDDAQSIVFDATTLFDYDKFSGFDRAEGGTRANVGLNYKLQFDSGQYMSVLFGRSFHLAGRNSYAYTDVLGATRDSGLETARSDYVSSLYFDTRYGVKVGAQTRFDGTDFSVRRVQAQATATYGPVVSSLAYAFLSEQPDLGIDRPREEILGSASLRLIQNWRVFGSLRYDLENENIVQDGVGIGYDDEGFSVSLSYQEDRSRNNGDPVDRMVYLRVGLRTIGNTQVSSGVNR
ncbi:LPS-assembly protein LptD [Polymorphum gilvum]|uniref:LPS-assembly protein LptD n=1 Tax=Polymorphum gilvum TaxID=991904 RepID=UPI001F5AE4D7|nr:LPS-assembly protein LptD [Polymorphum gilvum]